MEGELNAPKELLKWMFRQSDHTLPAIGLALTEKLVNTDTSMHKNFVKMCHKLQKEIDEILGTEMNTVVCSTLPTSNLSPLVHISFWTSDLNHS